MNFVTLTSKADFSAIWEQEWSVDNHSHTQKFESILEPEWNFNLAENINMTLLGRLRFDGSSNLSLDADKAEVDIAEWYFDIEFNDSFWRIGKQQVVWGQADGLKILDVVNPQTYREFILDDFEDSRLALWMLNIEIPINDDDSLQVLWIPDLSYNKFAKPGAAYQFTSPLFVPQLGDGHTLNSYNNNEPTSEINDSDFGIRYSMFAEGWDLTFNYLYHYHDSAILYQVLTDSGINVESVYERNHLIGTSASNAFEDFTLRLEVGYNTDTFHLSKAINQDGIFKTAELASVIGVDWQGFEDVFISVQWFQSHLMDYDSSVIRPQDDNKLSFLYRHNFYNETLELDILTLYGVKKGDTSLQMKLSYLLEDNLKIWLGTDSFSGNNTGLFGQFTDQDRITFGFEWGFN